MIEPVHAIVFLPIGYDREKQGDWYPQGDDEGPDKSQRERKTDRQVEKKAISVSHTSKPTCRHGL